MQIKKGKICVVDLNSLDIILTRVEMPAKTMLTLVYLMEVFVLAIIIKQNTISKIWIKPKHHIKPNVMY